MTSSLTPLDALDALGLTEEALVASIRAWLNDPTVYGQRIIVGRDTEATNLAQRIRALASPLPPHEAFRELS